MKRWMALLLAAVLCFSLAACGDGQKEKNGDSDTPKEENNTLSEETAMTEEMLAKAVTVDEMEEVKAVIKETPDYLFSSDAQLGIYALHTLYEQNPVVFVEDYFESPYRITGYVKEINSDGLRLEIEPDAGENLEFSISVTLASTDKIREIKKGDLITIVGMLVETEGEQVSY